MHIMDVMKRDNSRRHLEICGKSKYFALLKFTSGHRSLQQLDLNLSIKYDRGSFWYSEIRTYWASLQSIISIYFRNQLDCLAYKKLCI